MLLWVNGMQIGHQKDAYRAANSWFLLNNRCFPLGLSPVLHPASLLIFSILQVLKPRFWGVFRAKHFTFEGAWGSTFLIFLGRNVSRYQAQPCFKP